MDGDFVRDGHVITSAVGTFKPNDFGLYDMAGNVSEWVPRPHTRKVWADRHPTSIRNTDMMRQKEDPYKMKRKIVRGGSWKDVARNIRSDLRMWEYQNEQRSYIGFRCVRSQIGFAKGTQKKEEIMVKIRKYANVIERFLHGEKGQRFSISHIRLAPLL